MSAFQVSSIDGSTEGISVGGRGEPGRRPQRDVLEREVASTLQRVADTRPADSYCGSAMGSSVGGAFFSRSSAGFSFTLWAGTPT